MHGTRIRASQIGLTRSIVATSLAVVSWARPAFGFGTLPTTWALLSIVHSEKKCLVEHSIRILVDTNALRRFKTYRFSSTFAKLVHVEFDMANGHSMGFVCYIAASRVTSQKTRHENSNR